MKSYKKIAPLFVVLGASFWGVDGIVLRPSLYTLPVSLVVFIESAIVAVLLTPLFYKRFSSFKLLGKGDWLAFVGVAIFGGALGTMAITKALFFVNYVNLSIVILIQKLQPAFAIIFAMILLREKPPKIFYLWDANEKKKIKVKATHLSGDEWQAWQRANEAVREQHQNYETNCRSL